MYLTPTSPQQIHANVTNPKQIEVGQWRLGNIMSNSHRPTDTTRQCCLCRVRQCELSRPERPTTVFSVRVRPAVALRRPTHCDAKRTCRAVGPTQFTPPHQTQQDGPVCVVSGMTVSTGQLL